MTEYIVNMSGDWTGKLTEVVRCRDCEHYDTEWTSEAHIGRHWCYVFSHYTEPEECCARGERR